MNLSVSTSQSLTLLSSLEVSRLLPSDVNLTDRTAAVCPLMVFVFMLVPGNHSLTVVSYEALARMF